MISFLPPQKQNTVRRVKTLPRNSILDTENHASCVSSQLNSLAFLIKVKCSTLPKTRDSLSSLTVLLEGHSPSPPTTVTPPPQMRERRQLSKNLPPNSSQTLQRYLNEKKIQIVNEPELQLNSDLPSLETPESWFKGQRIIGYFPNMAFMRDDQPYTFHSHHAIGRNVCSGHINISTGCVINGGLLFFVCVWSGITLRGRTDLHVLSRGYVNAQTYRAEILYVYVAPYAGAIDDAFILQDDNVRSQTTRIVDACLEQESVQSVQWPARSPDLNTI
ncbi:DDE_3 domain-containing protein [Trichonephila clavipes]|nr:DDE_3 domain-containing protein [Trichonephila clavipes]